MLFFRHYFSIQPKTWTSFAHEMSNMVKRDSNKSLNVSPRGSVYRVHVSNLSAVDGSNQKSINSPVEVTRLVVEIPLIKRRVWDTSPSQVVGLGIFEPSAVTLVKLSVFFDQLGTGFVFINNSWFATVGTLHEQRLKVVKPDFAGHRFVHTMLEMLDDVISINERISLQIVFMIFDI